MNLFPDSGFDQSAATPILLGVLISWLFTETFGWVFAGLVVPGYLATLFLLEPRSAMIDVLEAGVTYAVARAIGEHLSRTGLTSRVFGRERFLLIVVVSVLVRIATEGVAFVHILPRSTWAYSIGLVVVPLAANACWKTGLPRGFAHLGATTAMVYALLRFVLVPHTNLSLAGFDLATENIAASFLASPKGYVLLLTGAVFAAITNVRFGWDYNGILVPALMALVVMRPVKFVATFVEVVVLVALVRLLLSTTPARRWNIEGPRRTVLFFAADYGLRFAVAAIVGRYLPSRVLVDVTGFGYLLPTLIAVKIAQKGIASLVILPAAAVSAAAFVVGTGLGFAAKSVDAAASDLDREPVARRMTAAPKDPAAACLWLSSLARPTPPKWTAPMLSAERLARLAETTLADATARVPAHVEVEKLEDDVVLLREKFENADRRVGDPAVLLRPTPPTRARVVVVVPAPLASPTSAAIGGQWLVDRTVDAVVIAGIEDATPRMERAFVAQKVARLLARSSAGAEGLVVTLRDRASGDTGLRAAKDSSRARDVREFVRRLGPIGDQLVVDGEPLGADGDLEVNVSESSARTWLPSVSVGAVSTSPTGLVMRFDEVSASTAQMATEDLIAMRRLLLEPILGLSAYTPSAILAASATMMGYRLTAVRSSSGGEYVSLVPSRRRGSIAVLARTSGVSGLVIEVPQGARDPLRRMAIRLGEQMHADAVLVGLSSGSVFDNGALAEAHVAATWPRPGRDARVLLLREGAVAGPAPAAIGHWGGAAAEALSEDVREALSRIGIDASSEPTRPSAAEEASRSVFGDAPLVAITIGERGLRDRLLASADGAVTELASFPVLDEECGAIAQRLGVALSSAAKPAPASLLGIAQRAAIERSITARRELERATRETAAAGAIARASTGVYLVVAGRDVDGLAVGAYPLAMVSAARDLAPVSAPSLEACAALIDAGGACRASFQ